MYTMYYNYYDTNTLNYSTCNFQQSKLKINLTVVVIEIYGWCQPDIIASTPSLSFSTENYQQS